MSGIKPKTLFIPSMKTSDMTRNLSRSTSGRYNIILLYNSRMTDIEDANYLFSEYGISVTGKKTLNKEKDIYAVKDDILLTLNTQLLEVYFKNII